MSTTHQRSLVLAQHKAVKTEAEAAGLSIYEFGLGSPVGKPKWLTQTSTFFPRLAELLEGIEDHGYCLKGWPGLKEAYSNWYGKMGIKAGPEQFLESDGARGLIYRAVTALLPYQFARLQEIENPPDHPVAIVQDPCYGPFVEAVEQAGGEVIFVPCDRSRNYFDGIESVIKTTKVCLLYLNCFHNPTGEGCTEQELRWVVEQANDRGFLILSDRTYSELAFPGRGSPQLSIFNIPESWRVAYEVFTLSKIFGLARWRIGGGLGRKRFMRLVRKERSRYGYGLALPSEIAGFLALTEHFEGISAQAKDVAERAQLWTGLLPGSYMPPGGFFLWWDVQDVMRSLSVDNSAEFCDLVMRRTGVEFWSGMAYATPGVGRTKVRISLGQPTEVIEPAFEKLARAGIIPGLNRSRLQIA